MQVFQQQLYLSSAASHAQGASGKPSGLPPSSGPKGGCRQCTTRLSAVSATRLAAVFTSRSPIVMPPAVRAWNKRDSYAVPYAGDELAHTLINMWFGG